MLIDAHANMASRDIVKEEEDAALRNNKPGDLSVPKQVYDAVVKAIIPRRAMAERLGCAAFKIDVFQLPVTPLKIFPKDPPAQAKRKKELEAAAKRPQGRQPGAMKKQAPTPTQRTSRQKAADEAKAKADKEKKIAADKALKEAAAAEKKANAAAAKNQNSSRNAAAGVVDGGQPMPQNPHSLPAHLHSLHGNQYGSPNSSNASSNLYGSLTSAQSEAITELNRNVMDLRSKMGAQEEEYKERIKTLEALNAKQSSEMSTVCSQLAASQATVQELRTQHATAVSMQNTFERMCNNMLKTMETMQVAPR